MALKKEIRQEDGVITNYHRIFFIQCATNHHNSIAVMSYVDNESRKEEQLNQLSPYRKTITYETAYDPSMDIEKAYEYLKTLPIFEGSENI